MAVQPRLPGQTTPVQGAGLAAADPRGAAYGISKRVLRELGTYNAQKGAYESPLAPLPNVPNRTATPKTGQFASAKALLSDLGSIRSQYAAASSQEERTRLEGQYNRLVQNAEDLGFSSQELADFYYDPKSLEYYSSSGYSGSANVFTSDSALLTDVPTSTTNYRRPRTVAAGYDPENKIVTVIFRDGTPWNYYGVPEDAWIKFHQSITKGPFLNNAKTNSGRGPGDLLTYAGHGPADISQLSPAAQREFYRISRASQVLAKDKTTGNAQQNRRPKSQPNLIRRQNQQYYAKLAAKQGKNPNANRGRNRSK